MQRGNVFFAMAVVSMLVFSLTASLYAEETAIKEESPKKAEKVKEVTKKLQGTIASVDQATGTIIVKTKKENETISIDNTTLIKVKKVKKATINDLKADQSVKVTYKIKDGKRIATKIGAKPAAKTKEKIETKPLENEEGKAQDMG
jgi:hypothetical protein